MPNPATDTRSSGGLLSDAYGALTRVFGGLWSRYGGMGWTRVRLLLPSARFDWEREAGDVWANSIVALAIAWLGDRLPRPRVRVCKILRNGDHQPLGRSDLLDLWQRPNPHYGRRTLEKAIALSLKVDGNAYLYKVRDRMGKVVELWWVPHYRILPTWPADGSAYIDGYRVWLDTAVYHLPAADVLHIRDGIDPRNERLGLSAVKASLREVCTVNYEASYTGALLKNSGVPATLIVPDGDGPQGVTVRPDPAAAERISERFVDEFSGDNTGRPLVMAGRYKVVPAGFNPEQMAIKALTISAQARVAASIGVAAMSLGLPDPNKTYSNLAEANRSSWGTIVAMQELIAESVRHDLLPEFGLDPLAYTVEYDYSHIQELQESLDSLHQRTREDFKADVITRNEAREQVGYEPDAGPDGDRFYTEIQAGGQPAAAAPADDDEPDVLPVPAPSGKRLLRLLEGLKKNGSGEHCHPFLDGKYNHYHGRDGRFVSKPQGGGHATGSATRVTFARPAEKPAGGAGGGGQQPEHRGQAATGRDMGGKSEKEISAVHKEMDSGWRKSLSEDQRQDLRIYTGQSYDGINRGLRDKQTAKQTANSPIVKSLDKSLATSSLKEDTVVYRGISNPSALGLHPEKAIGATISDPAYLSTSLNSKLASKYAGDSGAVLRIKAPKGSQGASMGGISRYPNEHEILFGRNTKMRITGVRKQGKQTIYEAEIAA